MRCDTTPFIKIAFATAAPCPSSVKRLCHGKCLSSPHTSRLAQVVYARSSLRMTSINSSKPNGVECNTNGTGSAWDHKTTALLAWCKTNGIRMPKLSIQHTEFGRSLIAIAEVLPSESMIFVSAAMTLSVDTGSSDPPALSRLPLSEDSDFWRLASWEVRLALVLLNEVRQGSSSLWAPYIASLPEEPSAALLALHAPGGPGMRAREQLGRIGLLDVADAYCAHIHATHAALGAALAPEAVPVTPQEFRWAVACAQSRAFSIPGNAGEGVRRFAMFPGLDCGNHSARTRCNLEYEEETGEFVVRAGFGVRAGQEAFLNYGTKTSGDLVLFYGFVECGSPSCSVPLGIECVWDAQDDDEDVRLRRRKDALLETLGLADEDVTFVLGLHEVDPRLMMALRVAVGSESDVAAIERMEVQADGTGFGSVGLKNEVKAWKCVERYCQSLMQSAGPLVEEFEARMRSPEPYSLAWEWGADRNCSAEALFRFEESRVLKTTIERVRHFRSVSEKIGIVCTVLLPPSVSMLKTDLLDSDGVPGGSGVHQYVVDAT